MSYEEETTDLRARVRELEAELAAANDGRIADQTRFWKARAEKAEAANAKMADIIHSMGHCNSRTSDGPRTGGGVG